MQTEPQLSDPISPAYGKFFTRFAEIDTLPTNEWQVVHLIGYWVAKYKNHYNIDYTFKFNHSAPSKSWEVLNIKKISQMLSSDPAILKDYIDYFFQKVIVEKKKRITSIALLADTNVINKYKHFYMNSNQAIDRASPLPAKYWQVIQTHGSINAKNIKTFGDLAFFKLSLNEYSDPKDMALFGELQKVGMDLKILEKVK